MKDNIDFSIKNSEHLNNDLTLDQLLNYFNDNIIVASKFTVEHHKIAYPNYEQFVSVPGTHNIEKWISAVREILFLEKSGNKRVDSIKKVTSNWKHMEVYDFLNWMKFYQNNDHIKYKKAQFLPNNSPNYFLKLRDDGKLNNTDIDFSEPEVSNKLPLSERKRIIERHRNKIVSRLDSAEKLLRSDEGELFAGKELASLIKSIYELKTKIQLVNKLSLATKLYEDMIIREANVLHSKGSINAALFLKKIADDSESDNLQSLKSTLLPAPAAPPTTVSGDIGGLPSMGPGMPQTPGKPENNNNPNLLLEAPEIENVDETAGIRGFLNNLNGGGIVPANEELDEDSADDDLLVTEAQALPVQPLPAKPQPPKVEPKSTLKPPAPVNKNIDTLEPKPVSTELNVKEDDEVKPTSDIDNMINSMFSKISVNDVIVKLENLSKIFNTREIPRQLAIVDMMLDSLGLATYFPNLSEATNKALESNNYIATRIDDILVKLRSSTLTTNIDLDGDDVAIKPEVQNIKNNLEKEDEQDQRRKEMRKKKEDKALEQSVKEEPEIELGDLNQELPQLQTAPVKQPAVPTQPKQV